MTIPVCGSLIDGKIMCWGNNENGQLGNGSYRGYSETPLEVSGLTNAKSIALGASYSCASLTYDCFPFMCLADRRQE